MKRIIFTLILISSAMPALSNKNKNSWYEKDYVKHHCKGKIEHKLDDKIRVDCLTDTHAIEYDWSKKLLKKGHP